MNISKQLYDIPEEKECRLWHKYILSTYDLLSKLDETIYEAGLYTNQVCVYVYVRVCTRARVCVCVCVCEHVHLHACV